MSVQHQDAEQRRKCRVSFDETCSIAFVEPLKTSLTRQEKDYVWCNPDEMASFVSAARNICHEFTDAHDLNPPVYVQGLELRRSLQRQERKYMSIQCVLMAQRSGKMTSDVLACFASKCNRWATQVATIQGQRDFLMAAVADSGLKGESLCLPPLPKMTPFPVPFKSKAFSVKENNTKRRVRQRVTTCGAGI